MQDLLFYIFAALTLLCGLLVILNRNPVNSAMFLVLSIISLAGLFVLLHAFFLAAVQVIVYAGAVIILFLFVIMLLDLREEERRHIKRLGAIAGLAAAGVFAFGLYQVISITTFKAGPASATVEGTTVALGQTLFIKYGLPLEILSVLLLSAMVGVILLSKKDLK